MSLPPPPPLADASFRRPSARHVIRPPLALSKQRRPRTLASELGGVAASFPRCSHPGGTRWGSLVCRDVGIANASPPGATSSSGGDEINEMLEGCRTENSSLGTSFLAKLAIALGIAVTITLISAYLKSPSSGTSFKLPIVSDGSSQLVPSACNDGFTVTLFGYRIIIPEYTPGCGFGKRPLQAGFGFWRKINLWNVRLKLLNSQKRNYFGEAVGLLLVAYGCWMWAIYKRRGTKYLGLSFVLVGISLARNLCLDGNWQSFSESLAKNAPYIVSTVLWVYWGVCISDMIPFYLGKLFRLTKASDDICAKLGVGKEKALSITRVIRKYGNFIGFVERFSVGVRNPTSFLAGAWGISSQCFFAGVCCGGLVTVPIQLGIGFLLRERPVVALASVATAVGIWTVFPYLLAALTALFLFLRQHRSN